MDEKEIIYFSIIGDFNTLKNTNKNNDNTDNKKILFPKKKLNSYQLTEKFIKDLNHKVDYYCTHTNKIKTIKDYYTPNKFVSSNPKNTIYVPNNKNPTSDFFHIDGHLDTKKYNNLNYEKNYYKILLKKLEKKDENEKIEKIKKKEINDLKLLELNKKEDEFNNKLNYYDFSKKPKKIHIYENLIKQTKYDCEKFPFYLRYDLLKNKKIKVKKDENENENKDNKDNKEDENIMFLNQEKKHIITNLNISEKIFYNKYKFREKNIFDEFKPYQKNFFQ
jgi:hypothetical protein